MADWNQPTLTTDYATVLPNLKDRDSDALTLAESPTNPPTGAIRYNRTLNKFQEWTGAVWVDKVISLAGGGTGGTDAASARTGLGLGTMAVQNSNAVTITGGAISGLTALAVTGDAVISGRLDVSSTAVNAFKVAGGIRAGSGNVDIVDTTGKIPALSATYFASLTALGSWTFPGLTSTDKVRITNTDPHIDFNESDAGVDEKFWRFISLAGDLNLQPINDLYTIGGPSAIVFKRTGNLCDQIDLSPATVEFTAAAGNIKIGPAGASATFNHGAGLINIIIGGSTQAIQFTSAGLEVAADPNGFGAPGNILKVGRNSTGTGAPGRLQLQDKDGVTWEVWVDTTGDLRIGGTAPVEAGSDTIGTVVGTQT